MKLRKYIKKPLRSLRTIILSIVKKTSNVYNVIIIQKTTQNRNHVVIAMQDIQKWLFCIIFAKIVIRNKVFQLAVNNAIRELKPTTL